MGGRKKEELLFNGYRIFVKDDEKVLGMDSSNDYKNVNVFNDMELHTYKWLKWYYVMHILLQ